MYEYRNIYLQIQIQEHEKKETMTYPFIQTMTGRTPLILTR